MFAVEGIGTGRGAQVVLGVLLFLRLRGLLRQQRGEKGFVQNLFCRQAIAGGHAQEFLEEVNKLRRGVLGQGRLARANALVQVLFGGG